MPHILLVMAILPPAPGGQADLDPVGRTITGPGALELNAGLQQPRGDAIAVLPIRHDASRQQPQDVRGQMLDGYAGQDQEAAVAENARQVCGPLRIAPPEPVIARRKPPGRRADGDAADLPHPRAADQVSDLRAAQRPAPLRMIRLQERIPSPALRGAAGDGLQLDAAQIRQCPAVSRHIRRCRTGTPPPRLGVIARRWQLDQPAALQLQEVFAARHLLRSAPHVAPAEVLAHL